MWKYLYLYDYSSKVETGIATYHLQGKVSCGGINSSKLSTLMRRGSHGGISRDISSNSTC